MTAWGGSDSGVVGLRCANPTYGFLFATIKRAPWLVIELLRYLPPRPWTVEYLPMTLAQAADRCYVRENT